MERIEERCVSSLGLSFAGLPMCKSSTCTAVAILFRLELRGGRSNFRVTGTVALGAVEALLSPREWLISDDIEAVLSTFLAEYVVLVR